jgi:putative flippase GtrA
MGFTPSALLEHARSDAGRKKLRYAGVSVVFVPLGQILIQVFALMFKANSGEPNFTKASITASAVLTLPNFYANSRFVWKDTPTDNRRTQVLVFWVAAMLGVTFATILTAIVEHATKDSSHLWQAIAVFFAQLVGFGIVWVGRFMLLDRWLFKVTHHGEEPTPEDLDELHREFPV